MIMPTANQTAKLPAMIWVVVSKMAKTQITPSETVIVDGMAIAPAAIPFNDPVKLPSNAPKDTPATIAVPKANLKPRRTIAVARMIPDPRTTKGAST